MATRRTTVEIDERELSEAARNLGTRGVKETVNSALREVNRTAALRRAAACAREGRLRLPDETTWARWREPRW